MVILRASKQAQSSPSFNMLVDPTQTATLSQNRNSRPVPVREVLHCFTTLPVRNTRHIDRENAGIHAAQGDWERITKKPLPTPFYGSYGEKGSFAGLTCPGSSPERMEVLAYMYELSFLMDGKSSRCQYCTGKKCSRGRQTWTTA